MARQQLTIAALMLVIVIGAFDFWCCGLFLVSDKRGGSLAFILPASFGWLGMVLSRGRQKPFLDGFCYAVSAAFLATIVFGLLFHDVMVAQLNDWIVRS